MMLLEVFLHDSLVVDLNLVDHKVAHNLVVDRVGLVVVDTLDSVVDSVVVDTLDAEEAEVVAQLVVVVQLAAVAEMALRVAAAVLQVLDSELVVEVQKDDKHFAGGFVEHLD